MKSGIPIIFIHKGYSWYLHYSFKQALSRNKYARFFILGDNAVNKFSAAKFVNIQSYENSVRELRKHYQHRSDNNPEIELFCFERWFYLRELMKEYELKKIFTCDSDVMLFTNVEDEDSQMGNYEAAFCIPYKQDNFRLSASAHVSYWTYEGLDRFCKFISDNFLFPPAEVDEKWNHVVKNNLNGGISDMAYLNLFSREVKIINLAAEREGAVYDDNISSSENYFPNEYLIEAGRKKIIWKDKFPYGFNKLSNKICRFKSLHFQGSAKRMMPEFYCVQQGWFKAKKVKIELKADKIVKKIKRRIGFR